MFMLAYNYVLLIKLIKLMIVNDSAKCRLLLVVTICKRIGLDRLLCDTSFHNIGLRYNNERGIYKQESF